MSRTQVVTGPPSAGSILRPQLAGADFVHACQATTRRDGRSALQAYRDMAATIPGWFDGLIGPGKAVDTDKHFVISVNAPFAAGVCANPSETP